MQKSREIIISRELMRQINMTNNAIAKVKTAVPNNSEKRLAQAGEILNSLDDLKDATIKDLFGSMPKVGEDNK